MRRSGLILSSSACVQKISSIADGLCDGEISPGDAYGITLLAGAGFMEPVREKSIDRGLGEMGLRGVVGGYGRR